MKSIFTYPLNPNNYYIDPNYIGDDTVGFQKRVKDLKDGNYKTWVNTTTRGSVNDIMSGMSRYNKIPTLEESNGNNTFYKFWEQPLIEFRMRAKSATIKDISTEAVTITDNGTDYYFVKIRVETNDPHGLTTGDRLDVYGGNTTPEWNDIVTFYAQVINTTEFYLMSVDTPASNPPVKDNFIISELQGTIYDNRQWGGNLVGRVIRDDSSGSHGSIIRFNTAPQNFDNDSVIRLASNFTESHDTGTANSTSTTFYVTRLGGSEYSYHLFTDSDKTTPATLDEAYYTSATKNYTSAGTIDLETQTYADWGISTVSKNTLQADGTGWCRIEATVTNGTFTGSDDSSKDIPTTTTYATDFYWTADPTFFKIEDVRGDAGIIQDFILADAGSGVDVDITIRFINPARTQGGYYYYTDNSTVDEDMVIAEHNTTFRYEVFEANVLLPGNIQYQYQNSSNVTTAGARYNTGWYLVDSDVLQTLDTDESFPNNNTINVDSNGYLTGFTFPAGISDDRGDFDTLDNRYLILDSLPDEYTPPTPTPAEQEDVFDTDDEWADYGYSGGAKQWPFHVTPSSAEIVYNSPTIVNNSQSGIKYTRSAGHTDWRLEVTYPPMNSADFQKFHAIAQAAQGQAMPFFFNLVDKTGQNILWRKFYPGSGTIVLRYKDAVALGARTALLEGYASNESNAFVQGEVFIDGKNDNGRLHTALNTVDANIYGEAKIRTTWPFVEAQTPGNTIYREPYHAIVTLNNDNFEYSVDTAGYYYVSVGFDLDSWK